MTRTQPNSTNEWRNIKITPPWEREDFRWLFPYYSAPKSGDAQMVIVEESHKAILSVGHYRKNANHFHYRINMELLLDKSLTEVGVGGRQEAPLTAWLKLASESLNSTHEKSEVIFNVIIYPDRRSNERVAHQINKWVFESTAHQLPVDITVEPRVTFKAKHAWLTELSKRASEVNGRVDVHFVDCGIVRGSTLRRTESLIASLLGDDQFQFSSVFQLVNRLSQKTLNHIAKEDCHFEFADISVGHLQTYDNSCYLCSYDRELRSVERSSSLASVAAMIRDKRLRETVEMRADEPAALVPMDHNRRAYWDPKEDVRLEWVKRQRWGYHRLAWTHWWNVTLGALNDEKDKDRYDKSHVLERVVSTLRAELGKAPQKRVSTFLGGRPLALEHLMGALASLADQPFAKQMGARDACLTTVLSLATAVIKGKNVDLPPGYSLPKPDDWVDLQETVRNLCVTQKDLVSDFVRCLMRQATALGSSWLTRRDAVISLFTWAIAEYDCVNQTDSARDKLKGFSDFYLYCLRLLLMAGNDRAKAARWDFLLIFGQEYKEKLPEPQGELLFGKILVTEALRGVPKRTKANTEGVLKDFVDMAFIDNTRIIHSVLTSLGSIGEDDDPTTRPFPPEFFQETMKWANIVDSEKCQDVLASAGRALPTEWSPSQMSQLAVTQSLKRIHEVWTAFTDTALTHIDGVEVCLLANVPTEPLILTSVRHPRDQCWKVEKSSLRHTYLKIASNIDKEDGGMISSPTNWIKRIEDPSPLFRWGATPPRPGSVFPGGTGNGGFSSWDVLVGEEKAQGLMWAVLRLGIWRTDDKKRDVREAYIGITWRKPRLSAIMSKDGDTSLSLKSGIRAVLSLRGRIGGMIMTERGDELIDGLVSKQRIEQQLLKVRSLNHSRTDAETSSDTDQKKIEEDMLRDPILLPNNIRSLYFGRERDRILGDMNRLLLLGENQRQEQSYLVDQFDYVWKPGGESAVPTITNWLDAVSRWLCACPERSRIDIFASDDGVAPSLNPVVTLSKTRHSLEKLWAEARSQGGLLPESILYPTPKASAILLTACVQGACRVSKGKKVRIDIIDGGAYVAVSNRVPYDPKLVERIREGVARESDGISLSVVAGVFHAIAPDRPVRFRLSPIDGAKKSGERVFSVEMPILISQPNQSGGRPNVTVETYAEEGSVQLSSQPALPFERP